MKRYVIKTNGTTCFPNGVCRPQSVEQWDGGELRCAVVPALAREGKIQPAPLISEGDELWLWAHETKEYGNGWGITAKATAGPQRLDGDRLFLTLRDTKLLPRPFGFEDLGQGPSGSRLFDFLKIYRQHTSYIIEDDDYDDFVRLIEERSAPISEELQKQHLTFEEDAIRRNNAEILDAAQERRFGLQKLRPEQRRFREVQMERHQGRCVVTRCYVPEALEASHVVPHTGAPEFEAPENGLLLRSDLHKLFDRYLWTIHPVSGTIRVSSRLKDTGYRKLAGREVDHKLSRAFLENHFRLFEKWEKEQQA